MKILTCLLLAFAVASQAQENQLAGAIDIHVHCAPDSVPRKIDAIDLARMAKDRGMRGLVLKNHYEPTASLAYVVRKVVPGLEVFGGVDLNLSMGGMNPAAVERMALTTGGYGRLVWMSTFDSEAQVRYSKENRPFVRVSQNGQLLPETKQVIALIAKDNLVLATGHPTAEEALMELREGKKQGVKHMVVTHAMIAPIHMSDAQMREAAQLGAYVEFVYNGLIGTYKEFTFKDYARAIRYVGVEHCILSSDMGQPANPMHPDGLLLLFKGLEEQGITKPEINRMAKENPARLLGLQ
jgi:Family of unknown function (DUF6282)